MSTQNTIPTTFDRVRELARKAISPIRPADKPSQHGEEPLVSGKRLSAGNDLPPYYLVYFLLVELLGYPHDGKEEKVAWSVPIEFEGATYAVAHRKMGLGVFGKGSKKAEDHAGQIVRLIERGVREAQPFFRWMAEQAVKAAQFNILNNSGQLFERYRYFRNSYRRMRARAQLKKSKPSVQQARDVGEVLSSILSTFPPFELGQRRDWMAMAAIEAFFSWTEHVFILLAVLQSSVATGDEVKKLVDADWVDKFKVVLDVNEPTTQRHYNDLLLIRRQVRNFLAHGAFGKEGKAFRFHSNAGAVPVALDYTSQKARFSISPELAFDDAWAIKTIDEFTAYLWSGPREAARLYIQESGLPIVLPMSRDGSYKAAMASTDEMEKFVEQLSYLFDKAANMDW